MNKTVEKAVKAMRSLPEKEATLAAQVVLSVVEQRHGLETLEAIARKARKQAKAAGLTEAAMDALLKNG